jgi:polygalacturonase
MLIAHYLEAQFPDHIEEAKAKIERSIVTPSIPEYVVRITQFGAKGDSLTNCKKAFDRAMKACKKRKGGTILVPKGVYTVNGPIHFESRVKIHLEKGAKIRFGSNPKDYLPMVLSSWEGTMIYNYSPLIYAKDKRNIAITGEGVIDGEAAATWMQWKELEGADKLLSRKMNHTALPLEERLFGDGHYLRPQLLQFVGCENILLEGVQFEDSPFWCVHLLKSKHITIRDISFDAHNSNNDGIDLEYASNVLIEGVDFNNGDDNIAIKAGRDYEGRSNLATPTENILVRNCRFKGLHALVIGSEMAAGVRNVFVNDCEATGYLKRGIYFKTNSDRGGYIKDIYVSNITLGKVEDFIYMTANYHGEGSGLFPSRISDIHLSNISCGEVTNTAIVIEGFPTEKVTNVTLDHIQAESAKNGMTLTNTENVIFNEIVIGEKAGTPSAVSNSLK